MAALTLGAVEGGDEEEESDEEDEDAAGDVEDDILTKLGRQLGRPATGDVPISFTTADIPQAFSCFSYRFSERKFLVCDLQGVLDEKSSPPCFELTDPVIHYRSSTGRTKVFGRGLDSCTSQLNLSRSWSLKPQQDSTYQINLKRFCH